MMKTLMLAAAAVISFGAGSAHAESGGEDGGTIANTFFTTLPGEISTMPGARPNGVAANPRSAPTTAYTTNSSVSTAVCL